MNPEAVYTIEAAYAALSQVKIAIQNSFTEVTLFVQMTKQFETNPYGYQSQELMNDMSQKGTDVNQSLIVTLNELSIAVDLCSKLIKIKTQKLKAHITEWKRKQKLASNGDPHFDPNELNILQSWCDSLDEMAQFTLSCLSETKTLLSKDILSTYYGQAYVDEQIKKLDILMMRFTSVLALLIKETFVIVKQPPQVMKTNTKFQAQLRSLVGTKMLENGHLTQVDVRATIINEGDANTFILKGEIPRVEIGEIMENRGRMEYEQKSNEFSAILRNMQLKKVKRAEKKGSESVVDEKFWILFTANFRVIGGRDIIASTISLPVTVIVHGNQEPRAWATITWANGFSSLGHVPFSTPDKVPLDILMKTLNTKFTSITRRLLSENDIKYMKDKLIESRFVNESREVSWSKFCKENLENRNFTFWDWFYAIMKLIAERLKDLWLDGTIIGFISKYDTEQSLLPCGVGTFLLRFSDSALGCISIAFVEIDSESGNKIVTMVKPYSSSELAIRSLANRLKDALNLLFLYHNIPKDVAFGKYYTNAEVQPSVTDPYAERTLCEVIRSRGGSTDVAHTLVPNIPYDIMHSGPNTPSTYHSPSPTETISMPTYSDHQSFNFNYPNEDSHDLTVLESSISPNTFLPTNIMDICSDNVDIKPQ